MFSWILFFTCTKIAYWVSTSCVPWNWLKSLCGGGVCKPNLVFYFSPDQAFGLGLRLGPSRTKPERKKALRIVGISRQFQKYIFNYGKKKFVWDFKNNVLLLKCCNLELHFFKFVFLAICILYYPCLSNRSGSNC